MHRDNPAELRAALEKEFELVKNAFYTEPGDQSAWFYHRWLIEQFCGPLSVTYGTNNNNNTQTDPASRKLLERELHMCQELLQIEPNSDWTILTSVFLMMRLGGYEEQVVKNLKLLVSIDPLRTNFYEDLAAMVPKSKA